METVSVGLEMGKGEAALLRRLPGFALAISIAALIAPSAASAQYPNPLPDFSHSSAPHDELYSPASGDRDRPLLVIYYNFTDRAYPAGVDAPAIANRAFGGYPSVEDWFRTQSSGKLILARAAETDSSNGGAVNDGVVSVTIPMTFDQWVAMPAPHQAQHRKRLLEAADPYVNFANFDTNNDTKVGPLELGVAVVIVDSGRGGQTAWNDAVNLDGVDIEEPVDLTSTSTPLMTMIHERVHATVNAQDLYGFGMGPYDVMGRCGCTNTDFMLANAFQKLHLGWAAPMVVHRDGYYQVRATPASNDSYILYDWARGTDDYFLVENRDPQPGGYDNPFPGYKDPGLIVYRVDDRLTQRSMSDSERPIELIRPDGTTPSGGPSQNYPDGCSPIPNEPQRIGCAQYEGSNRDAFDPNDNATLERKMDAPWRDGTNSRVAVRAVHDAGDPTRVYFDVRGPGVLVDAWPIDRNGPPGVAGNQANQIIFPVRNTGEAADTFDFTITGLPLGWTASTDTQNLQAGQDSTATVAVTPSALSPSGLYTLEALGTSTSDASVTTRDPFQVLQGAQADLGVTITDSADPVATGERYRYRIAVTNQGPDAAAGPRVVDRLPAGLQAVKGGSRCRDSSPPAREYTCGAGDANGQLVPGARHKLKLVVQANPGAAGANLTNMVTVTSLTPDPDAADDVAAVTTRITRGKNGGNGGDGGGAGSGGGGGDGTAEAGSGGGLPFTGLLLAPLLALGCALLLGGRAVRRRTQPTPRRRPRARPATGGTPTRSAASARPARPQRATQALAAIKPGQPLPAWFIARSLLRATAALGGAPTRAEYSRWRQEQEIGGRRPASAAAIARRFGGWRPALSVVADVGDVPDATRQLARRVARV